MSPDFWSWAYDAYGIRLSQTVTKSTAPSQSLSVNTGTKKVNGWSYYAAGNTLNDGLHTYTCDANNQIKELTADPSSRNTMDRDRG